MQKMCCWSYYSSTNYHHYLKIPVGCLKAFTIVFGAISLILLSFSQISSFQDIFSLITIITCLIASTIYFMLYYFHPEIRYSRSNKQFDNVFHLLAGLILIVAGTDLTSLLTYKSRISLDTEGTGLDAFREQYFEPGYTKGAAKIFMFINGVIYEIIAFIRVKGEDDSFDYDDIDEEDEDMQERIRLRSHVEPGLNLT